MMLRLRAFCAIVVVAAMSASAQAQAVKGFAALKTMELNSAAAPDLKGGIVFPYGAFDLSAKPEAMVLLQLAFPNGQKFIHDKLDYKGEYTDPGTGIAGYLYHLKGAAYERFFLVSKEGVQGQGDSQRYVVDFDVNGTVIRVDVGTFARKP